MSVVAVVVRAIEYDHCLPVAVNPCEQCDGVANDVAFSLLADDVPSFEGQGHARIPGLAAAASADRMDGGDAARARFATNSRRGGDVMRALARSKVARVVPQPQGGRGVLAADDREAGGIEREVAAMVSSERERA